MITQGKLGWMAAILGLRAHIYHKTNQMRATPQLVLLVDSKDHYVIKELANMTGTSPEARRQNQQKDFMQRGCVAHCPEAHVHHHLNWSMPETMRWSATGASAAVVIFNCLPYIHSEKNFTALLNEALENVSVQGPGSGAVKAVLLRLASLGWRMPPELEDAAVNAIIQAREDAGKAS